MTLTSKNVKNKTFIKKLSKTFRPKIFGLRRFKSDKQANAYNLTVHSLRVLQSRRVTNDHRAREQIT